MNSEIQVFISYAKGDEDAAIRLYGELNKEGVEPWLDEKDILGGQNREQTIRQNIKASKYFLALISNNSDSKRGHAQKELKIALDLLDEFGSNSIFVIPISLDGAKSCDENLQKLQHVDLSTSYDKGLEKLLQVLKRDEEDKKKKPFQNPTPSPLGAWDEIFVGRETFVEELMFSSGSIFIFGARRIGKTVLLKYFEKMCMESNTPSFYLSLQGVGTTDKIKRKLKVCFKRKTFPIDETLFKVHSFFDFLEELDVKLNQRIVLLLDEAEQIASIDKKEPGFIEKMRSSIETLENIRFIFAASPHFKKVVAKSQCSPFQSAFDIMMLPVMTKTEIMDLAKSLAPEAKSEKIEKALTFTHYQPYLMKIFINKLMDGEKLHAPTKDIAMDVYVGNALDGIFPNYFEGLSEELQKIVLEIHQNRFRYQEKHETKLRELAQYGYLRCEDGVYKIPNWFFQHWLDTRADKTG